MCFSILLYDWHAIAIFVHNKDWCINKVYNYDKNHRVSHLCNIMVLISKGWHMGRGLGIYLVFYMFIAYVVCWSVDWWILFSKKDLSLKRIGIVGERNLGHETALLVHGVLNGHQPTIGQPHRVLAVYLQQFKRVLVLIKKLILLYCSYFSLSVAHFVLIKEQVLFRIFDLVLVFVL